MPSGKRSVELNKEGRAILSIWLPKRELLAVAKMGADHVSVEFINSKIESEASYFSFWPAMSNDSDFSEMVVRNFNSSSYLRTKNYDNINCGRRPPDIKIEVNLPDMPGYQKFYREFLESNYPWSWLGSNRIMKFLISRSNASNCSQAIY